MSDMPSAAPDPAAAQIGIPLDLAPLLTPYGHYPRLSVRVVHLPSLVCLSKGMSNEDRSWSLAPADLVGLELLVPEDTDPPIALAIRIVGIDKNENATIVGQFDVPLFAIRATSKSTDGPPPAPAEPTDWERRTERRVAAALRLGERRVAQALAEAEAQWEGESERRLSEQVEQLDQGWQRKFRSERAVRGEAETRATEAAQKLTLLSDELEAALARAAAAEAAEADRVRDMQRAAEAAEARLADELAKQAAATEVKWEAESEIRIAAAVQQAVQDAEAAAEARLEEARAAWQEGADREIAALKQRCAEAESAARHPGAGLAEAEAQWQAESERQLSALAQRLEQEWQQKVASERAARDAAEVRAGDAAQKLSELSQELEAVRAAAAAAEAPDAGRDSDRQRYAAEAEARLAEELAKQVAAAQAHWDAESGDRVAVAVAQAVQEAEAAAATRLEQAREDWQGEAQAALAAAEVQWHAEEVKRFARARSEWHKEALAAVNKDRRALRSVARRQRLAGAGRHFRRIGLIAGGLVAVYFLYTEFRPTLVKQWLPQAMALVSDIETAARSRLESLWDAVQPQTAVVTDIANLRAGPSTAREVLTTLPRGTVVTVMERRDDWIRVQAGGDPSDQGWLHHSLLEAAQ